MVLAHCHRWWCTDACKMSESRCWGMLLPVPYRGTLRCKHGDRRCKLNYVANDYTAKKTAAGSEEQKICIASKHRADGWVKKAMFLPSRKHDRWQINALLARCVRDRQPTGSRVRVGTCADVMVLLFPTPAGMESDFIYALVCLCVCCVLKTRAARVLAGVTG